MKNKTVIKLFFFLVCLFASSCGGNKEKTVIRILFYGISDSNIETIQTLLDEKFGGSGKPFKLLFEKGDETLPIKSILEKEKHFSLAFTANTKQILFSGTLNEFGASCSSFPPFIRSRFEKNSFAAPFLINPYSLLCTKTALEKTKDISSFSLEQFENSMKPAIADNNFPLICAGGNDETLLFFIYAAGALNGSIPEFEEVRKADFKKSIPKELKNTMDLLVKWRKNGYLHPEWFLMKEKDISFFMEFKNTPMCFIGLEEYKHINQEISKKYSAVFFPSYGSEKKILPVNIISIIMPVQNKKYLTDEKQDYILSIADYCMSGAGQSELAEACKLVPVNIDASTEDSKTADARYMVFAADAAVPDYADSFLNTHDDIQILANEIRLYLKVNGMGY